MKRLIIVFSALFLASCEPTESQQRRYNDNGEFTGLVLTYKDPKTDKEYLVFWDHYNGPIGVAER